MIVSLPDEEYMKFSGYSKKESLIAAIKKFLIDDYVVEILENGYIHIVNKTTRTLQWRRKYSPRTSYLIPKFLMRIKEK